MIKERTNISSVFLQDLIKRQPVFAPFTSPIYSNDAFGVLSFALESIKNKSFTDMMDNMFDQLGLSQTSYTTPSSDVQGVIPWNVSYSGWDIDEAAGNPYVPLLLYVVISITVPKQCRFNLRLNNGYVQSRSIHS
jgi:CubicO group peptidase (beta-lactamase class C family)